METLLEHVYQIRLPLPFRLNHVNSYLIQDEYGWSVIDPGLNTPTTKNAWLRTLRHFNLRPSDIKRIFITHFHPDHYGFAGTMQRWTHAEVIASPRTFALAERYFSNEQARRDFHYYRKCGMPEHLAEEVAVLDSQLLDQISPIMGSKGHVQEHEKIMLGGKPFKIIVGGGHAEGSTGFWNEEERILIGGDMLLQKITPNITYSYEDDEEDNPLQQYFDTLSALQRRNILTVLPGHGPVFHPAPGFIESVISHHEERLDHILGIVQDAEKDALTVYDICLRLFHKVFNTDSARFALGETSAHLRFLEKKNLLRLQESLGIYYVVVP
jgi:glyoxylase-like metal-dependent hydrolase (beta-lactamase superfamily II)